MNKPANKKQSSKKNQKNDFDASRFVDLLTMAVTVFSIILIALFIRGTVVNYIPPVHGISIDTGSFGDFFSYFKFVLLFVYTILVVVLLLIKTVILGDNLRPTYAHWPIIGLISLILLSCVFSDYKSLSLFGMYDHYEGSVAWICYFLIVLVLANVDFKNLKYSIGDWITYALTALIGINFIILLFDALGSNIIQLSAVKFFVVPTELNSEKLIGAIYSTLSNPNYCSGFAAACLAYLASYAIIDKRVKMRVLSIAGSVLSIFVIYWSHSLSGYVALLVAYPFLIAVLTRTSILKVKTGIFITIGLIVFGSLSFYGMYMYGPQSIKQSISIRLDSLSNFVYGDNNAQAPGLMVTPGTVIENGTEITMQIVKAPDNGKYRYWMRYENDAQAHSTEWTDEATYKAVATPSGLIRLWAEVDTNGEITTTETVFLHCLALKQVQGFDYSVFNPIVYRDIEFDSGRLYMWQNVSTLVVQRPLFGYGLDTLALYFPQHTRDSLETYSTGIVTKAHNVYIDIAYGAGIIALLLFLFFIGLHVSESWKGIKRADTNDKAFLTALFMFLITFLVQWLSNDSVIGSSVVFWVLVGISASYNTTYRHGEIN